MTDKNSLRAVAVLDGNRITYECEINGPWREAFMLDGPKGWFCTMNDGESEFFAEYEEGIESVPQSIAILPFLSNVLPIAWFYDADIHVPELDADFYECLPAVKEGMQQRHPDAELGGRVTPDKVVKNTIDKGENSISLFSGGVDATFTAISHLENKPILATVWGADIYLRQKTEWAEVRRQNESTASRFGVPFSSIKSSFRSAINYKPLTDKFAAPLKMPGWWYSVQHSIALVCLAAPLAWVRNANHIYIASSYSTEDDPGTKCCNWPNIDGNVRYAGLGVTHHDFNVTRQQKVRAICDFFDENPSPMNLRVCWSAVSSTNCCACEKCARTIYALIGERHDPNNFGFRCDDAAYENMEMLIKTKKIRVSSFWDAVAIRIKENVPNWQNISHIATMMDAHDKATRRPG